MKERRVSIDAMHPGPDMNESKPASRATCPIPEDESLPSRVNSAKFILENYERSRSHQYYPRDPSPLHFTHLNSPRPNANFMASPMRSYSFDKERRRRRCGGFASCFCCSILATLCSVFVTAGILLGLTTLIAWLILRPIHAPRYFVDNLEFRSLSVSAPTNELDIATLNANVMFTITAENRNGKMGFKYDGVGIDTSYRGNVFGYSAVSSFALGHRNTTTLTSEFVVENYLFTPPRLGRDFAADVALASLALHVRASAKVRVKVGVITSFAVKVFVDCDFVVKPPNASAPSSVISKTCKLTR